jgi:hypothetical protein
MTAENDKSDDILLGTLRRDVSISFGNTDVQKLVLKYGRPFSPGPRPIGIRQRTSKQCFMNSFLVAEEGRAFYVEGYALKISSPSKHAFQHAWNTLDGIRAFDTTLKDNSDCLYLGVVVPVGLVGEELFKVGHYIPFLDARKPFAEMEALLQRALNSPPAYEEFKSTAR